MKCCSVPAFAVSLVLCLTLPSAAVAQSTASHLAIRQWVRSEQGIVRGAVVSPRLSGNVGPVSNVKVVLSRQGAESVRVTTDAEGLFTAENVTPGVYALTVSSDHLLAACALHVLDASHDPDGKYPQEATISIADVDRPTVKTAIVRYLPPVVSSTPPTLSGVNFSDLADNVRTPGEVVQIVQRGDGGFAGRLFLPGATGAELTAAPLSNVFLLQDGKQLDRTLTDERGEFVFEQAMPGIYSMLAIGPGGVALLGFELTAMAPRSAAVPATADAEQQLVARMQEVTPDGLSLQLAPVPEAVEGMEAVQDGEVVMIEEQEGVPLVLDEACCGESIVDACCAPVCGGTFHSGGGGGGGGGGGAGFGGFGGLLAVGALVAITGDDDPILIPNPASPVAP
jgi:hypothetical protein